MDQNQTSNLDETSDEETDQTYILEEEEMYQTNHMEDVGRKRYKSDLMREGQRMKAKLEKIHNQAKSLESIGGLALAAIEEALELVDESLEAFKNGGNERKVVAYAFYALPHKIKEDDMKLFAEFIDAKLGWDVPFKMRFTNRMSRTGYIIFEEQYLPKVKKTFQLSFRFLEREVVGKS